MAVFSDIVKSYYSQECKCGKFQIQMESSDLNLHSLEKVTQCREPKSISEGSSTHSLPSDAKLFDLLSSPTSCCPFIIFQGSPVLKEQSSIEGLSSGIHEKILNYNRKEKSLEELTKKFINKFEGRNQHILELDKVTKELGVQRRRIYDIINILQSLRVVLKKGKNNYRWKGLSAAVRTIEYCQKNPDSFQIFQVRKEKSLQYLASRFLKLFIRRPSISLEEAAKEIIQDLSEQELKTKIRRLYDIVNVFKSLFLVKKMSLGTKKPGFKWLGVENLKKFIEEKNRIRQEEKLPVKEPKTPQKKTLISPKKSSENGSSFLINLLETKIGMKNLDQLSIIFRDHVWPEEKMLQKEIRPFYEEQNEEFIDEKKEILENQSLFRR